MRSSLLLSCLTVLSISIVTSGCQNTTDLGRPCTLGRKDPTDTDASDGFRSIPIKEKELIAGSDYISFGSLDCDDLICVRDASQPPGNPDDDATGFCSRRCLQTNESSCNTGDEALDEAGTYGCRSLLLDEVTLASIRQADPVKYEKHFGETTSPYFCAKPLPSN